MTTPRKRLASLMDGLTLPEGFKLTATREHLLRQLGIMLIKNGKLTCYGPAVRGGRLHGRWTTLWKRSDFAALRSMAAAQWVKAVPQAGSLNHRWSQNDVVFQSGIEQLARRLGAQELLWEERRQESWRGAEEAYTELRTKLYQAQAVVNKASYKPTLDDNDVLSAYRALRALTGEVSEAERKLQEIKSRVKLVPEPSADDALTWLMEQELKRANEQ